METFCQCNYVTHLTRTCLFQCKTVCNWVIFHVDQICYSEAAVESSKTIMVLNVGRHVECQLSRVTCWLLTLSPSWFRKCVDFCLETRVHDCWLCGGGPAV